MPLRASSLGPSLLILSAAAAIWAIAVALTGGFDLRLGAVRLSSHSPWTASAVALVAALAAVLLTAADDRRPALVAVKSRRHLAPPLAAMALSIAVALAALTKGSFVASGSDIYGYVSQAHLWAAGRPHVDQPLLRELRWPNAERAIAPLGYRPATTGDAIVPVYPPGLPLVMALFERVAGPEAVFWVVPLLSGLAVWATYFLGARVAGPGTGLAASCLLATSPVFLAQSLVAMSDVPATAWWALSLALLTWNRRDAALAAGLAAGLAVMTRPNLVPLLLVLVVLVIRTGREDRGRRATQRLILLGVGALPAVVALGLINGHLYGSPFRSGYESLRELYSWSHLAPNLRRYPAWIVQDTPIILLALAAPLVFRRQNPRSPIAHPRSVVVCWLIFAVAVLLSYLFYQPFESPGYLRFLLPAIPPLLALTAGALAVLLRPSGRAAPILAVVVIGAVSLGRLSSAVERGVFDVARVEQTSAAVGRYIATRLPERAVLISMQHSGSIRYYSGRVTLRYDWILRQRLEWLIGELRRLGYHPYIVLDEWEVPRFRAKFQDHTPIGALDWPPLAEHASGPRIYDPADRPAPNQGTTVRTDAIR